VSRSTLWSTIATAQKTNSGSKLLRILIWVALCERGICGDTVGARGAPVSVVGEAWFEIGGAFGKYGLVRSRVGATGCAVAFAISVAVSIAVVGLGWWSALRRANLLVPLGRARGSWRRRVVAVVCWLAINVHRYKNRCGFKELYLLVLGDQEL